MKKYIKTFQEFINERYTPDYRDWESIWDGVLTDDDAYVLGKICLGYTNEIDVKEISYDSFIEYFNLFEISNDTRKISLGGDKFIISGEKIINYVKENWSHINEVLIKLIKGDDSSNENNNKVDEFSKQMKDLENYIINNYEMLDNTVSSTETKNGYYVEIPITNEGVIIPNPDVTSEDNLVFSICASPSLQKYIRKNKNYYYENLDMEEFDMEIGEMINEDNILEIHFNDPYKDWTNENIIELVDELLNSVPNPALRKISEE